MELRYKKRIRSVLILGISTFIVFFVLGYVSAGNIAPSAAPASTFYTLSEIFNPLASSSYDSSSFTADSNGNIIEMSKCIIAKMYGQNC